MNLEDIMLEKFKKAMAEMSQEDFDAIWKEISAYDHEDENPILAKDLIKSFNLEIK